MLLIENTEARVITIGLKRQPEGIDLRPGVNEVTPADWKEAKAGQVVGFMIKARTLRLVGAKAFEKLPRDAAQEVALNTFDLELLRKWESMPLDKEVAKAVRVQITEMTTLPPPDSDAAV